MSFNYNKLKGRIVEKFGTLDKFSDKTKMSATTIGRKLSGKSLWSQDEIIKACELLEIPMDEMTAYFFCIAS